LSEIAKTFNRLRCRKHLYESGLYKRSGVPAENLAFSYAIMPLAGTDSINSIAKSGDCLVRSLCSDYDQSTLNRLINSNGNWHGFHRRLVRELQTHKEIKMSQDGIAILDSTHLAKRYSKSLQGLRYVKDISTGEYVKGYEVVVLCYSDPEKIYPLDLGIKTVWNDKIGIAIKQAELMAEELPFIDTIAFDAWFYTARLAKTIQRLGKKFVTKSKRNYKYTVDGVPMKASEILRLGKSVMAERKGFGQVKLVPAWTAKGEALLVTNDLRMADDRARGIYATRFGIDNPFFRGMKDQLGLEEFHMRKFGGIVAHCFLRLLTYVLVTAVKLMKGLAGRTIEWVKRHAISVAAAIITAGRRIKVILFPDRPPP
jgi:hypothetical protein